MKTQKWVQAKKNAYDGDDWGDYDEYDEYGANREPEPEPEPEPASRYFAQRFNQQSRSFTDPTRQAPPQSARRNSFEAGEEHRAFSTSVAQPQQDYAHQQHHGQPPHQARGVGPGMSGSSDEQHNSSASAMPTPLQTRISSTPADVYSSPSNSQFPPRKSSISHMSSPIAASPRSRTGSSEKPLPFIRPADIYKRVEEERRRASLDAAGPNPDSLSSRPADGAEIPQTESGKPPPPLETVAERKSEHPPDHDMAFQQDDHPAQANDPQSSQQTRLPPLRPISTFSNDPWSGAFQSQTQASGSVVSPSSDPSFRSFVDQAFTRRDEQRSVPPTPVSNSDSEMHRSNTGSTSGISPIMSRVPSSAAAAAKLRNQGSTPAIAEERETPVSRPTSAYIPDVQHQGPQKPSPGHSRNVSASSIPRSGLITPTSGDSPARSPVIASRIALPAPEAAQIATESPDSADAIEGGLSRPSSAYATREADIANAMMSSPVKSVPELSAAELKSQETFLESHNAQSPIRDVMPRDRSESPSKGRVQALAGKFGDVSNSRRGSTQSDHSRHSFQSWERSHDHSRAPSPTKADPSKPSSPAKEFRPHLPGQWESYTTTAITPSDQSEKEKGLGSEHNNISAPLEEVDLTPTTAKQPVSVIEPSQSSGTISALAEDPISALKEAGAAVVQSIRTTVGLDDASSEPQQEQRRYSQDRPHGDVYMPRPLQLDRTISATSSIPPTPPAKDTPDFESPPSWGEDTPQTFAQKQRPSMIPQLSTAPSADDQESDRLRKEIVASLNPLRLSTVSVPEPSRNSLQPASPDANRASSILPLEYESYWADESRVSPRPSQDVQRSLPEASPAVPASPPARSEDPIAPLLAHRFSWESNTPTQTTPDAQAQTKILPEPTKGLQQDTTTSPTIERAAEEERKQWADGLPGTSSDPDNTSTATKLDPITDGNLETQPSTLPLDSVKILHSPTQESKRLSGLHVVNSELNPEAVDLPPRLSADMSHPTQPSRDEPTTSQQQMEDGAPNPAVASMKGLTEPSTVQDSTPNSSPLPTTDKPLSAREIATINSTQERIATYNKMRDHWATVDHGLGNWISAAFEANPDLAMQPLPLQRVATGTSRHRHTGSLPLLGKLTASMSGQPQVAAQNDQPTASVFTGSSSPTTPMQSSSTLGLSSRAARDQMQAQMQAKGEKLLHTAGVLSGKGMTSAKGLFAKGKSRFGRDKVDK